MWIEHDNEFYNLDHYKQIVRGGDDEILLARIDNNGDWDHHEHLIAILKFPSKEDRETAWKQLQVKLAVKLI